MELAVDFAQTVAGDVGIEFRGTDGRVAKQFLDDTQVRAVFEEVRGETVAKHVRGDIAGDAGQSDPTFDAQPHGNRGEGRAALREEDIGGRAWRDELGSARMEIAI